MPATVWKGSISFGLVSFPVRLFPAARAETVHFHMLHKKDLSRVKESWRCVAEDIAIDRDDIVKGYETTKGQYVVVADDELARVAPETASVMTVLQFVRADEVDPLFFEHSYYVAADAQGSKPYGLFAAALDATGRHAIAKLTMHNREHIVLIRPSGRSLVLHTLYYVNELHAANKHEAPKADYTAKELALAKSLITGLAAPFKPAEFTDTYREHVERLVEEKRKGRAITTVAQPKHARPINLMDALKRSISAAGSAKSTGRRKSAAPSRTKTTRRHRAA